MTANNAAKTGGRRSGKAAQNQETPAVTEVNPGEATAMSVENPVNSETTQEDSMAADKVVKITARPVQENAQEGALQLSQPTAMVWNRPVMPSDIEVKETLTVAGVRPIAASNLELFGSFLNGRPIFASHLHVCDMLPGNSPIFESEFKMVEGALLPGHRPIMVSHPELLAASMLPGNRPIASNDIEDPEPAVLMGYLD